MQPAIIPCQSFKPVENAQFELSQWIKLLNNYHANVITSDISTYSVVMNIAKPADSVSKENMI